MNQPLSPMSSISIIVFWFIQVIHNNVVHSFSPCLRSTRHHHHHHHQNQHQQCNENIIKYNDVTTSIFATSTTDDNQTASSSTSTSASTSTVDKSSSSSKNNNKNNGGMTALHFIGEKVYKSDPIPIMHNHHHDLCSFFAKDEFRYLLFNSNDDASTIRLLPNKQVDETIMNLWCKQCQIVGGEPPDMIDNNDVVFLVNTGGINFSGLKIKSNSYIGVKYLKQEDGERYSDVVDHGDDAVVVVDDNDNNSNLSKPQYQLVFIKDSQYAEGPRLLVWIYNQLTGRNNNNNSDNDQQSEKEQSVHAFSKFTFEITPDGKSLVFVVESKLEVIVKFPALLLKVLPVSKEKAEQQGSASVLKAMSTDIEAVLPKIRDSYRQTFGNVL